MESMEDFSRGFLGEIFIEVMKECLEKCLQEWFVKVLLRNPEKSFWRTSRRILYRSLWNNFLMNPWKLFEGVAVGISEENHERFFKRIPRGTTEGIYGMFSYFLRESLEEYLKESLEKILKESEEEFLNQPIERFLHEYILWKKIQKNLHRINFWINRWILGFFKEYLEQFLKNPIF